MNKTMLERYEQAQTLLQGTTVDNELVRNDRVFPHWIPCTDQSMSDCFWYHRQTLEGKEYRFVDTATASNVLAFDHHALANALSHVLEIQEETSEPTESTTKTTQESIDPIEVCIRMFSSRAPCAVQNESISAASLAF